MDAKYTIHNVEVVKLLFDLLPHFALTEQLTLVDNFVQITRKSLLNKSRCCMIGLISILLDQILSVTSEELTSTSNLSELNTYLESMMLYTNRMLR